jgi:hypothetical protein
MYIGNILAPLLGIILLHQQMIEGFQTQIQDAGLVTETAVVQFFANHGRRFNNRIYAS